MERDHSLQGLLAAAGTAFERIVPAPCLVCEGTGGPLCSACARAHADELRPEPFDASPHALALPLTPEGALRPAWAGAAYTGLRSAMMLAFKAEGRTALSRPLALFLGGALRAAGAGPGDLILPVPGRFLAWMSRGFDPLADLLQEGDVAAASQGAVLTSQVLRRRPPVRGAPRSAGGQKGLGARGRTRRLSGAFEVGTRWMPVVSEARRVIIVDDVLTTGATAGAAIRAVENAGARSVVVATALAARGTGAAEDWPGRSAHG